MKEIKGLNSEQIEIVKRNILNLLKAHDKVVRLDAWERLKMVLDTRIISITEVTGLKEEFENLLDQENLEQRLLSWLVARDMLEDGTISKRVLKIHSDKFKEILRADDIKLRLHS